MDVVFASKAHLVGHGRLFILNPNLVQGFRLDAPFKVKSVLFYTYASIVCYTDYPFLREERNP